MLLPKTILSNEGRILCNTINHPLRTVKNKIENFFKFENIDNLKSEICIKQNFDDLNVPLTHPVRNIRDTFYLNENYIKNYNSILSTYYIPFDILNTFYKYYLSNKLLSHDKIILKRTHMTSHLNDLLKGSYTNVIYTGQVYRKDEIDKYHYPIFHQTDGFLIKPEMFNVEIELKQKLEQLIYYLFNKNNIEIKWESDTSFPFTHPSYELYIKRKQDNKWIEILGCGKIKNEVLAMSLYHNHINKIIENEITIYNKTLLNSFQEKFLSNEKETIRQSHLINHLCNKQLNHNIQIKINELLKSINYQGWAFGIGLERLCMLLYDINDIRLFWSNDKRFINQFKENQITTFRPFSNFPCIQKDISFYIKQYFNETSFFQICRDIANDNIEQIQKIDKYYDPKNNQTSLCYRITYRSHNKNLTHNEVNGIQNKIVQILMDQFEVSIR